jgi:hypothetical protein
MRASLLAALALAVLFPETEVGRAVAAVPEDAREAPAAAVVGVGILSKSDNAARRATLRESWFQLPAARAGLVVPLFFVAEPPSAVFRRALEEEQAVHGDVHLLPGLPEACEFRVLVPLRTPARPLTRYVCSPVQALLAISRLLHAVWQYRCVW